MPDPHHLIFRGEMTAKHCDRGKMHGWTCQRCRRASRQFSLRCLASGRNYCGGRAVLYDGMVSLHYDSALPGNQTHEPFIRFQRQFEVGVRALGIIVLLGLLTFRLSAAGNENPEVTTDPARYPAWIQAMKVAERGPFARILWFCLDGTTLPPARNGCQEHGGGRQHGGWNERTRLLRADGYFIANIMSALDESFVDEPDFTNRFGQILVEKFLVGIDDGWILRRALFYRGAFQEEGESAGARRVLQEMASRPHWLEAGFLALRTGAKVLPHGEHRNSLSRIRHDSAMLAERDPAFSALRAKIHGAPDNGDADRVRQYANERAAPELRPEYAALAQEIDRTFAPQPLPATLRARADAWDRGPWLQEVLYDAADALEAAADPAVQLQITGALLADLRRSLPQIRAASVRLDVVDLSLQAEQEHFRAAAALRTRLDGRSRAELLEWLFAAADAAYGVGLLNARLHAALQDYRSVFSQGTLSLHDYQALLAYLARATGWGTQALRAHFGKPVDRLAEIEPMSRGFIPDQLRSSPLLFYSDLLERLQVDAGRLAGARHRIFAADVGAGLNALNPGLARGMLHAQSLVAGAEFDAGGIYLLPETIADLPPVAGILTAGEGNPLSHIQLLARNLGIPNVVVEDSLIPRIAMHHGEDTVLAVSPGGLVELSAWSERWAPYFPAGAQSAEVLIRPDLDKLDLAVTHPLPLNGLRAADSGRTVGPKAAMLGELKAHYPDAVARGVALPFGLFQRHALQRSWPGDPSGSTSVFEWMQGRYRVLASLPEGSVERARQTEDFRAQLQAVIAATPIDAALSAQLRDALVQVFGQGDLPGLFIRSDTNVEDLPGFTGAGLNLTLPNVVGFDALLAGIPRVWASPFTSRAFAWRQSLMEQPEHVYTSILLLESVPVEKSGVLVTRDLETGDQAMLSVAVNEGPGGAVDGQAAESLRIPLDGTPPRVLATATAPMRRVLRLEGGMAEVPASGRDVALQPAEIVQLVNFARDLPERFPAIVAADGQPVPADVEFGFLEGRLKLFQIRPFLDSPAARSSDYLQLMDAALRAAKDVRVVLAAEPQS